jgi:hypothetical protein
MTLRIPAKLFRDRIAASKPFVFALCLLPLAVLVWDCLHDGLGSDPVAQLEHRSGDWALRLLLAALALTPLRRLSGRAEFVRYRRMLGLFAFFYACVHLTIYLVIDLGGYWSQLLTEIAGAPATVGQCLAAAGAPGAHVDTRRDAPPRPSLAAVASAGVRVRVVAVNPMWSADHRERWSISTSWLSAGALGRLRSAPESLR